MELRFATYNFGGEPPLQLRLDPVLRARRVMEFVEDVKPDIIAFQEFRGKRAEHLAAMLDGQGFAIASHARYWPPEMIFYKKRSLEFRNGLRRPLDADLRDGSRLVPSRFVNWADFRLKSFSFRVCNFHLVGPGPKAAASHFVLTTTGFTDAVLLGDFNMTRGEYPYARLREHGWSDTADFRYHSDLGPTRHGYGLAKRDRRVDWIMAPSGWETRDHGVWRRDRIEEEPSDHYPVFAKLAAPRSREGMTLQETSSTRGSTAARIRQS